VLKIVLATFDRWFFNLDMQRGSGSDGLNAPLMGGGPSSSGNSCCVLL
jgi:hypothetical protein